MEDTGFLDRRFLRTPQISGAIGTILGACLGYWLHLLAVAHPGNEDPARFVAAFALTGTVVGVSVAYWTYVLRRIRHTRTRRHTHHRKPDFWSPLHGALAGAFLFGGGSFILSYTELPFLNGEPTGTEGYVFYANGLFSMGG